MGLNKQNWIFLGQQNAADMARGDMAEVAWIQGRSRPRLSFIIPMKLDPIHVAYKYV